MDRIAVCGTVDPGSIPGRRTFSLLEGWPSGLWRTPRKRVGENPQRFKSSTLRRIRGVLTDPAIILIPP